MTHVLKSIFVTSMLTLALNFTFGQKPIYLTIDPANDTLLVLSDGGETDLDCSLHRRVYWQKMDLRIVSFQIIPKRGSGDPFENRPTTIGNRCDSRVRLAGYLGDWYYKIKWKDNQSRYHTLDPKIAVKPITNGYTEFIMFLGFMITLITSIIFSSKWRKAKARIVELEKQAIELAKNNPQNT